jgi:hypothetical protein
MVGLFIGQDEELEIDRMAYMVEAEVATFYGLIPDFK